MKKYFLLSSLVLCLLSALILTGCKSKTGSYPNALAWDNTVYGVSAAEVSKDDIGKQLGEVRRKKEPMPIENGDANDTPIGSKIYEIKGTNTKDALAVEKNDKFYRLVKQGFLKQ